MKKYTIFIFVFTLVFTFFGFSASFVNADTECTFARTLKMGFFGNDVACLQQNLGISADGKFGPKTRAAVLAWQAKWGLVADGMFGSKSRANWVAHGGNSGNFPEGCESASGYNRITGLPCYAIPSQSSVIISGVSGPQTLNVNQEGTWTVSAYDKNGGNLSYSVTWGDEAYLANTYIDGRVPATVQSGTFTHVYTTSGIYTPTFVVSNQYGQNAKTSLSVNVGNVTNQNNFSVNPSSATIKIGDTVRLQALLNTCPIGAQCFIGPLPVQATWTSSNTNVATLAYASDCPPGVYCMMVAHDHLTAIVTGVSEGTSVITASYTDSSGNKFSATSMVTVYKTNSSVITVLSPNGGETWVKGMTETIKWNDNSTYASCPAWATDCYVSSAMPKYYDIFLQTYRAPCTSNICPMYMIAAPFTIAKGASGNSYNWSVSKILDSNGVAPDGVYTVQVCQSGTGVCDSSDNYFRITSNNQLPVFISSLSPSSGTIGTRVTITGTGFTPTGNRIKFGNLGSENNPAYNLNSNGTSITFIVPSSNYYSCWDTYPACMIAVTLTQPGTYPVSVINANGTSNVAYFTVISSQ